MTGNSLSTQLSLHIAEFPGASLPDTIVRATQRALLDGVGVMLAAGGLSEDILPFRSIAMHSTGPCLVLGTGHRSSVEHAALANGAMAHALDFEDAFDRVALHPNAAMIPAAMALAEHLGNIDGQTFVSALAVGCDLVCRLGLALETSLEARGWFPPLLLGGFGAAAACARLAGLTAAQTRDALSLMLCQFSAPGAIGHDALTSLRATREAFSAAAAVRSVLLARAGVRGFGQPFEGQGGFFQLYAGDRYDQAVLLDKLGEKFWGEELSFKLWPACRGTHSFIELALEAHNMPGFEFDQIREIQVDVGEIQRMLTEPLERKAAPRTLIDARFSIPFVCGLALVRGQVTLGDFTPAALQDSAILQVAAKTRPVRREAWDRKSATAGAMKILFANGKAWQGECLQPAGSPERPVSTQQLLHKFNDCLAQSDIAYDSEAAADCLIDMGSRPAVDFSAMEPLDRSPDGGYTTTCRSNCQTPPKFLALTIQRASLPRPQSVPAKISSGGGIVFPAPGPPA